MTRHCTPRGGGKVPEGGGGGSKRETGAPRISFIFLQFYPGANATGLTFHSLTDHPGRSFKLDSYPTETLR